MDLSSCYQYSLIIITNILYYGQILINGNLAEGSKGYLRTLHSFHYRPETTTKKKNLLIKKHTHIHRGQEVQCMYVGGGWSVMGV